MQEIQKSHKIRIQKLKSKNISLSSKDSFKFFKKIKPKRLDPYIFYPSTLLLHLVQHCIDTLRLTTLTKNRYEGLLRSKNEAVFEIRVDQSGTSSKR